MRVRVLIGRMFGFGRSIGYRFSAHRISLSAGGMASFITMAIAPAALAFGWIIGRLWDPSQLQHALHDLFDGVIPDPNGGGELVDALTTLIQQSSTAAVSMATIVGFLLAIYSASKVVRDGRYAFFSVFGLPVRQHGVVAYVSAAFATLGFLLAAAALAILLAFVPRIFEAMGIHYGGFLRVLHLVVMAALMYLAIVVAYRIAGGRPRVSWVSIGALFGTVWVAGVTVVIGASTGTSGSIGSTVLIFGAPIVLLFWAYFSFLGVFIGAEVEAELRQRGGLRAALTTDTSALGFQSPVTTGSTFPHVRLHRINNEPPQS